MKINVLNLLTIVYANLHNYSFIPFWALSPLRKLLRFLAKRMLPDYLSKVKSTDYGERCMGVCISLTSFPDRINDVWKVIKSLKNQSVLPEKIILWLSKMQFPNKECIPSSLRSEVDELFEIRMVDEDIRSHKKYYYFMKEFPDKAFITCDDDIYYHPNMVKYLIESSKLYPGCVIANITRTIGFDAKGGLLPYNKWKTNKISYKKEGLIQIGVGGVLYPPCSLHTLTLRKDLFTTLTPMADDIWLNCMARMNGTPVIQSAMKFLPLEIENDSPSLSSINGGQNYNDVQIENIRNFLRENKLQDVYSESCAKTEHICN